MKYRIITLCVAVFALLAAWCFCKRFGPSPERRDAFCSPRLFTAEVEHSLYKLCPDILEIVRSLDLSYRPRSARLCGFECDGEYLMLYIIYPDEGGEEIDDRNSPISHLYKKIEGEWMSQGAIVSSGSCSALSIQTALGMFPQK